MPNKQLQSVQIKQGTHHEVRDIAQFQVDMALESENTILDINTLIPGVTAVINDPQKGTYLVAIVDGQTVGSLLLTKEWSDWNNSNYWWIQSVYVKPEHRRKGIYRSLYARAKEMARQDGVAQIRLYVDKTNLRGQQTYQALGMHESHYLMYEEDLTQP